MTIVTNEYDVHAALTRIGSIDRMIATLVRKREGLVTTVLDNTNGTGQATVNGITFTLSASNTYDQTVMLANLKPGQVVRCQVRKLDNTLVKKNYPKVHAMSKVEGKRKFSLKG